MDKAIEINNKGVRHFLNREFGKAEECYKEALAMHPEYETALNNMGLLCHQKKEYEQAIDYFEKAIEVKPKETYYVNAGNAAACLGKMAEAESWYVKALEMNSRSVRALESLANLYEHNRVPGKAADLWKSLVEISGEEKYLIDYVKNLMKRGKYKQALDMLKHRVSKESSQAWYLTGICEYHLNNYGLAEEALKQALARDPDDEEIRRYLAVTYIAMGEMDKGVVQFDKILKINPDNFQIMTEKGVILLGLDQPVEALELFEKALSLSPGFDKAEKYLDMTRQLLEKDEPQNSQEQQQDAEKQ